MAYSNQTTHYGLPLPVGSDKSTWLDTNEAFEAIDSAVYTAAQTASSQAESISTLQSQMITANANITANATAISTEATTREAQDTAHSTAISNINTKLGNTSMVGHGDGTVTGILMDIVEGYDELVTGHTPVHITPLYTGLSTGVDSNLELYVDDYFIQVNGRVRLTQQADGIVNNSSIGNRIKVGTITAADMSAHFPNLTTSTTYIIGWVSTLTLGRAAARDSGEVTSGNILYKSAITLDLLANGTGELAIFSSGTTGNLYLKSPSQTSIGKFANMSTGVATDFQADGYSMLRKVSYTLPDME